MIFGPNLEMIETVAAGLGPLLDRVAFVGGASACLYVDDPAAQLVRPTNDVDCVMELTGRSEYTAVEDQLRRLGFTHVTDPEAPICRWRYKGVLVDVMPDEPAILGFSNRWYREGIAYAKRVQLPSGIWISCFTLPYFIASKLDAFRSRGGDFRTSHDIKDIVTVLDGRLSFDDIEAAPHSVAAYLRCEFRSCLADRSFTESVHGHLTPDSSNVARAQRITDFLTRFVRSQH